MNYLTKNYHTHTPRCRHADGNEREYIEKAIESGLTVLGFSDHSPQPFKKTDYVAPTRMPVSQAKEYGETILALKDEYKDKIDIRLGVEGEYYPEHFEEFKELILSIGCEYAILGQHFTNNEYDGVFFGRKCGDDELKQYVSRLTKGAESGFFSYFCHPDLCNYVGDEKTYRDCMKEICLLSNAYNLPLEINFLGLGEDRHYPSERFFSLAGEYGCKVIYGIDAHVPDSIGKVEVYEKAERFIKKFGLEKTEDIEYKLIKMR